MIQFVSKIINFSEPEKFVQFLPDKSEVVTNSEGYRGLSLIPIDKTEKRKIKNISISKITDSSYEKYYDGIEFLDRSTKAEQIEQTGEMSIELEVDTETTGGGEGTIKTTYAKAIDFKPEGWTGEGYENRINSVEIPVPEEGTEIREEIPSSFSPTNLNLIPSESEIESTNDSSTTGGIKGYISNAKSRTPAKNIFLYNGFNFNYSNSSIETIASCELYFVKSDFLYQLLKNNTETLKINDSAMDISDLATYEPDANFTRDEEDIKISYLENLITNTKGNRLKYITTISTANSNYPFEIEIDTSYDYILLFPSASPKSFSQKKPSLEVFFKLLDANTDSSTIEPTEDGVFAYPSGETTPQNVGDYAALYNHLNKVGVEYFVNHYNNFVKNFYKYNGIKDDSSNEKLYTLKDIKSVINFNIEDI